MSTAHVRSARRPGGTSGDAPRSRSPIVTWGLGLTAVALVGLLVAWLTGCDTAWTKGEGRRQKGGA